MINRSQLLSDLQALLRKLEADLLARTEAAEVPEVGTTLRAEYDQAKKADRTAQSYEQWRSDFVTQMAVAWVLNTVFLRFLEDNGLIDTPLLSGSGERLQQARDEQELYFREHPTETDREYLLHGFKRLAKLPGVAEIFGAQNLVWELPNWLSGDAAGELLRFFQRIDSGTGQLVHDFTDPEWDTRFLGDLYQDLSESARKKYALLQTPIFVEEFILDRTLDPAIEEFGLAGFRMIDPACGSGHFLLGAFAQILDRWQRKEPGTNVRALAQRSLDAVHGVDVNPYAIAVARFRLLLAALKAEGLTKLKNAPSFEFNLACGDSLLHGSGSLLALNPHYSRSEDAQALSRILQPGRYHAVVANPPYITPKDRALNEAYRKRYKTCHMKYSLAVPFMERIFDLAVDRGFTGQITANSFMKRGFGKKLIEEFFPTVDLTHIIDTSLACIPDHGTPTVILLGRNRQAIASTIRTGMGIKREDSQPDDPAKGLYWNAILTQIDFSGSESEYISVTDSPREVFYKHPWSIGGGGASDLKEILDSTAVLTLIDIVESVGPPSFAGVDDMFFSTQSALKNRAIEKQLIKPLCNGDVVRDWLINPDTYCIVPYDANYQLIPFNPNSRWGRYVWLTRRSSEGMVSFNKRTRKDLDEPWWSWYRWIPERFRSPFFITFAFVATHNHFVLDRGGKVFKQSAPVIKLSIEKTEENYLALLGLLNSSTGAFWMRQVFHDKGGGGIGGGIAAETWERFFEYDGTKIKAFPIPKSSPVELTKKIDKVGRDINLLLPSNIFSNQANSISAATLEQRKSKLKHLQNTMIAQQEELDWQCYQLYQLLDEDLTCRDELPPIQLGQRAFEIVMARKMAAGELETTWFERHRSTPITEFPAEWSEDYRKLVERRIEIIENDRNIALIEQPEYKRRWNTEPWESQLERALKDWLLNRLESYFDFDGRMNEEGNPTAKIVDPGNIGTIISINKLAEVASKDPEFMQVGALYRDNDAFDVLKLVTELVEAESVPLLLILRYKATGLRKRQEWEHTWELQRQEDAIDACTKLPKEHPDYLDLLAAKQLKQQTIGNIPVPPKYTNTDFLTSNYWRLRGKLDVPKERWVSFPYCEGADGLLPIAWAGYDHLQLALAISAYYVDVQERLGGRDDPRLIPLLGCLIELLPWLKQWHNDLHPQYELNMGDYFEGFITDEARQMDKTLDEIRAWEPPKRTARRRR